MISIGRLPIWRQVGDEDITHTAAAARLQREDALEARKYRMGVVHE